MKNCSYHTTLDSNIHRNYLKEIVDDYKSRGFICISTSSFKPARTISYLENYDKSKTVKIVYGFDSKEGYYVNITEGLNHVMGHI